jgi:hypothetical protein
VFGLSSRENYFSQAIIWSVKFAFKPCNCTKSTDIVKDYGKKRNIYNRILDVDFFFNWYIIEKPLTAKEEAENCGR